LTIGYTLTLEYQLQPGWLEPFVRGLQQGVATAWRCSACEKVSFPPIRVCDCGHTAGDWIDLSGVADIEHRCDGSEGSYALVHFQGSDTSTVVRLEGLDASSRIGYLQAAGSGEPALVLTAREGESCG